MCVSFISRVSRRRWCVPPLGCSTLLPPSVPLPPRLSLSLSLPSSSFFPLLPSPLLLISIYLYLSLSLSLSLHKRTRPRDGAVHRGGPVRCARLQPVSSVADVEARAEGACWVKSQERLTPLFLSLSSLSLTLPLSLSLSPSLSPQGLPVGRSGADLLGRLPGTCVFVFGERGRRGVGRGRDSDNCGCRSARDRFKPDMVEMDPERARLPTCLVLCAAACVSCAHLVACHEFVDCCAVVDFVTNLVWLCSWSPTPLRSRMCGR